ncbi:NlpC/P60 family protein [Streptomyces sp. NPDC006385]|uniref:NlpC/P60 family protein n=1 Tax=Streptomyces sp. NPDC006385 TaxID=3156761 RepID=UPI0033AD12C0
MRNSALASAALTSVALLAQTANAAPSLGDETPSREEVSRKVSSLYDQAESDTGTFNATRAASAGSRGRADRPTDAGRGPDAPAGNDDTRRGDTRRGDSALDRVARQWFDAARSKLGPTVPATLPSDKPERPGGTRSARPAERAVADLTDLGRASSGRPALEPPAAPAAELTSAPATGSAAVAELTAGPIAALPAPPETSHTPADQATQTALALPAPAAPPAEPAAEMTAESRQRSALKATKEQNQRKIDRARALLSAYIEQQNTPPTAIAPQPATPPATDTWSTPPALPADTGTTTQTPATATWSTTPAPTTDTWGTTPALPADTWGTTPTPATDTWNPTPARPVADTGTTTQTPATDTWSTTPALPADSWGTTPTPATDTWSTTPTPGTDTRSTTPALPADTWSTTPTPAADTRSTTQTPAAPAPWPATPAPPQSATGTQWQVLQDLRSADGLAAAPADTTAWSSTASLPLGAPAPAPTPTPAPAVTTPSPPALAPSSPAPAAAPQDTRAVRALDFARAQLGKPCVWGTTGPDAYDGAGLTQAAWKAAGITLPRTPQEQATAGRGIAVTSAEPGDLVLFHAGHVGICSGNGMMIHAPGPGAVIREESMHYAGESAIHSVIRPA